MAIIAKNKGGIDYDPIPEGIHIARCYGMFDIGSQYSERWKKTKREVIIIWELPHQRIDVVKDNVTQNLPRAFSQKFTLSLHEKSQLRKVLQSWRGKAFTKDELDGFDITKIVGAACQLQIIHAPSPDGSKVYANLSAIMPVSSQDMVAPAENPICIFSFEDDGIDFPKGMPTWIREIAAQSPEYIEAAERSVDTGQHYQAAEDADDELPF